MSLDARLDRLMPVLTAKERGLLVLQSLKEGTPEDPQWRSSIPPHQIDEFNRYIRLMNAANKRLGAIIMVIEKEVEKLQLYEAWLFTLHLWQLNLGEIDWLASVVAREPITASQHTKLLAAAEAEYLPVEAAAQILADEQRGWQDEDLEETTWSKELSVRNEAWERLCGEAEKELRRAAAAGEIEARGRGKALRIRRGAFDAWLGRPLTLYPQWAAGYEVVPDEQADRAERDRVTLANLREAIREVPLARLAGGDVAEQERSLGPLIDMIGENLARGLALRWTEARSVELAVDWIAKELDGMDPLRPVNRQSVEWCKAAIAKMAALSERYGRTVELLDPDAGEMAEMRGFLERGGRIFG